MSFGGDRHESLLARIERTYRHIRGLSLTPSQAVRLWSVDRPVVEAALATLVERRFLMRTVTGSYRRAGHADWHSGGEPEAT